jgi:hypothetical protein
VGPGSVLFFIFGFYAQSSSNVDKSMVFSSKVAFTRGDAEAREQQMANFYGLMVAELALLLNGAGV